MDTIKIEGLNIPTTIGIYAWEKQILQPVILDVELHCDVSNCNDLIENTIDYEKICNLITQFVSENKFQLIEHLANQVCEQIKSKFDIAKIKLKVSKPRAIKNAQNVSVLIER